MAAAETARRTFEEGIGAEGLPTIDLPASDLRGGVGLLKALVLAGLASSNGDARRQIQGGAVRVNDVVVSDGKMHLTEDALNPDGFIKLSMGRKKHVLLRAAS
jgi:tyrosyl-tRNA synthetase